MGVGLSRSKYSVREIRMMDGIRPCLGFQCQGTAMSYHASILPGITSVEEIAAVELHAALVSKNINDTS